MFKCSPISIDRGVITDCDEVRVDRPDRLLLAEAVISPERPQIRNRKVGSYVCNEMI